MATEVACAVRTTNRRHARTAHATAYVVVYSLGYIVQLDDFLTSQITESFLGISNNVASIFKNHSWIAHAAESHGHGADDAQSRHRQYPERSDGAVLRAAGFRR